MSVQFIDNAQRGQLAQMLANTRRTVAAFRQKHGQQQRFAIATTPNALGGPQAGTVTDPNLTGPYRQYYGELYKHISAKGQVLPVTGGLGETRVRQRQVDPGKPAVTVSMGAKAILTQAQGTGVGFDFVETHIPMYGEKFELGDPRNVATALLDGVSLEELVGAEHMMEMTGALEGFILNGIPGYALNGREISGILNNPFAVAGADSVDWTDNATTIEQILLDIEKWVQNLSDLHMARGMFTLYLGTGLLGRMNRLEITGNFRRTAIQEILATSGVISDVVFHDDIPVAKKILIGNSARIFAVRELLRPTVLAIPNQFSALPNGLNWQEYLLIGAATMTTGTDINGNVPILQAETAA